MKVRDSIIGQGTGDIISRDTSGGLVTGSMQ